MESNFHEAKAVPVHENLRTPIQRQASPEASPARWKGARGGKQKIAASELCSRTRVFIKHPLFLRISASDGSRDQVACQLAFGRV